MAEIAVTYPVGVIAYAPVDMSYKVDAVAYEGLLRQNGVQAAAAARRLALLKRALDAIPMMDRHEDLYHAIEVEVSNG